MKTKQRGTLYSTDSRVVLLIPGRDKFTLEELQLAVGGFIEQIAPLDKQTKLYANEDGITKNLPRNPHTFSIMNVAHYGYPKYFRILGNLISVYSVKEDEPDTGRVTVKEALREIPSVVLHGNKDGI